MALIPGGLPSYTANTSASLQTAPGLMLGNGKTNSSSQRPANILDFGVLIEVERPQDRTEGYEARFGPLMQTEIGKFQINANLLWGRHYRAVSNGPTELGYQAQIKYPVQPQFEIGLQAFGNMGQWKHWSEHDQQEHKIGPAIFGKVKVGEHQVIKYNAAWLFGTTAATADNTFRTQIELEF